MVHFEVTFIYIAYKIVGGRFLFVGQNNTNIKIKDHLQKEFFGGKHKIKSDKKNRRHLPRMLEKQILLPLVIVYPRRQSQGGNL